MQCIKVRTREEAEAVGEDDWGFLFRYPRGNGHVHFWLNYHEIQAINDYWNIYANDCDPTKVCWCVTRANPLDNGEVRHSEDCDYFQ